MLYRRIVSSLPLTSTAVTAPFYGSVTLLVSVGQRVGVDAPLAVLEALKLETVLTAPRAGTVEALPVPPSGLVSGGDVVAVLASL